MSRVRGRQTTTAFERVTELARHPSLLSTVELTPFRIAVIYLFFGMSFLFLSDVLFVAYLSDPLLSQAQAVKGGAEVLLTAVLIFLLTRRSHTQLTRANAEIRRKSNLITVLGRVLRHNLRNNMCVIRGYVSELKPHFEATESLDEFETVIEKTDEMIGLAEKARVLESIASAEFDHQVSDLTSLIERAASQLSEEYPSATITVTESRPIAVRVMPSLHIALRELVENAVKHAGEDPTVTVSIERTYRDGTRGLDGVVIKITDNGSGLPQSERNVLQQGFEEPLIHGSGLGLYTVYWVVTSHGGSIDITATHHGTTVEVTLPINSLDADIDEETHQSRLQRIQGRFEAVFEEASDAMLIADDDGRYMDANQRAADLFGVPKEDLLGRSIEAFLPDDMDFETVWQQFRTGDGEQDTITILRPDGTERIVEYSAAPEIVSGQHLAVLRDVTERERRKRELQETTRNLEAVISASPDPILALDAETRVQVWNEAAEDVFGYPAREVIGEPLTEIGLYARADRATVAERFERALAGETFTDLEVQRETKDGEQISLSISTAPLRDSEGEITGLMAVAKDITDRRDRQAELERKDRAMDAAPVGITISDPSQEDNPLIYVNDHFTGLTGYTEEEVCGSNCRFLQGEHTDPEPVARMREAIEDEEPVTVELRNYRKDGTEFWNRVSIAPVRGEEGEVVNYVGFQQDITEEKERALAQSSETA